MNLEIMGKDQDLFASGCEALVNATNCVGVMGAGLARIFAARFPRMNDDYVQAYKRGDLKLGVLHTYKNPEIDPKPGEYRWIVNFPTMHFPGEATRPETLQDGFKALEAFVRDKGVRSIAIPALGCGIGSFSFEELTKMVQEFADKLPGVQIKLYEPKDRR